MWQADKATGNASDNVPNIKNELLLCDAGCQNVQKMQGLKKGFK
jgi:hypothetical protein